LKKGEGIEGQGKALVVPPGFEWGTFNISPKDAELLMTRGFNVTDVCRWMGVPPILVGHSAEGQTMWGSGVEQIILGWLVLGLRAYLKRIEAAVNLRLLSDADRSKGIFFEFNFEGLLRADSAGRASLMSTLAQNGLRTRNELRKLDNMPPMDGGDQLTVQSALVPLDQIGAQQQGAEAVRNSLRAWLQQERDEKRDAA
jgi:HK97 family phage portal protein